MGLAEDNQQLRKLSRAVMRGELGRSDYQQQRRQIINAHTGDSNDDVDLTNPGIETVEPPADPTAPTLAAVRGEARIATTGTMPPLTAEVAQQAQGSDVWIGLVAVVLVVLVVAGALALFL